MILNVVLKMILRSWWRNKVFFLVSVASLALGLACTNLLMTYFVHEHGLEGRNPDRDRMFFQNPHYNIQVVLLGYPNF